MSKNRDHVAKDGAQEYEVGFGKPPIETRFKPGQSGNKKGRPKQNKDLLSLVFAALDKKVTVTEKGENYEAIYERRYCQELGYGGRKGGTESVEVHHGE